MSIKELSHCCSLLEGSIIEARGNLFFAILFIDAGFLGVNQAESDLFATVESRMNTKINTSQQKSKGLSNCLSLFFSLIGGFWELTKRRVIYLPLWSLE